MEINFFDQSEVPQPRANVKIERVAVAPYPDGFRVKLSIDVTPFQERPSLEIRLRATDTKRILAELSVIETMHRQMEFTVHLRGVQSPVGDYVAEVELYYDDRATPQDRHAENFAIK